MRSDGGRSTTASRKALSATEFLGPWARRFTSSGKGLDDGPPLLGTAYIDTPCWRLPATCAGARGGRTQLFEEAPSRRSAESRSLVADALDHYFGAASTEKSVQPFLAVAAHHVDMAGFLGTLGRARGAAARRIDLFSSLVVRITASSFHAGTGGGAYNACVGKGKSTSRRCLAAARTLHHAWLFGVWLW